MENQHRKITGYRELSKEEVDLMNRIKAKGAELLALQTELVEKLQADFHQLKGGSPSECQVDEFNRFQAAEPLRWAAIGKTDVQTGIMALVRAVAQPAGV
jgi:hypothetical protein